MGKWATWAGCGGDHPYCAFFSSSPTTHYLLSYFYYLFLFILPILPTVAKLRGSSQLDGQDDGQRDCARYPMSLRYPVHMSAGHCAEKDRLLLEYRQAADQYAVAVAELSRRIGISSLDDYQKLHQAAESARIRSNEARDRLARHLAAHGCDISKAS